ncbi:MAG: transposase [Tannerellaceae bacterium]
MEDKIKGLYIKRTQRDYPMSFKMSVVREVESGELSIRGALRKYGIQSHGTVLNWCRKFGKFDREMFVSKMTMQSPQQRIYELEQENERLRRQNTFLQQEVENATDKAGILDKIIEIAEEDFKIQIRKKRLPEQSEGTPKRSKKR